MTSETKYLQQKRGWTKPSAPSDIAAKLTMLNDLGEVTKEWLLKQGKFVLGNGTDCSIQISAEGIAEQNALLVIGARQVYLRSLVRNMTQDNFPRNELIIESQSGRFELAGNKFEIGLLSRNESDKQPQHRPPKSRMQFTLARPDVLAQNRETPASLFQRADSLGANPVFSDGDALDEEAKPIDPAWVANLVQSAIEPLESQIQNVLNFPPRHRDGRQSRRSATTDALEAVFGGKPSDDKVIVAREEIPQKLDELAEKQNVALDKIGEQITDITQQLGGLEALVTSEKELQDLRAKKEEEKSSAQNQAIGQLQNGMVSVSEALQSLRAKQEDESRAEGEWRQEVQTQVSDLRNSVDNLVNTTEKERQAQVRQGDEAQQQDNGWRSDIQNQIIGLRQSVEVLLENSNAQQIASDNSEQIRSADEANWRTDVQGQITELKQSITSLVESAESNQRAIQDDIGARTQE